MASTKIGERQANFWRQVTKVRFFWLFVALVVYILAAPSFPGKIAGQLGAVGMLVVILFAATYVSQGMIRFWAMGWLGILLFGGIGLNVLIPEVPAVKLVFLSIAVVALAYTTVCMLTFVLESGRVGLEHIYGAICAYVMIAMGFATIDLMLEIVAPGSFSNVRDPNFDNRPWWEFFYFSFTTLSTVGYGDIAPLTMRARSFAIIEQLISVFYVATLIARLTGLYSHSAVEEEESKPR